MRIGIDGRPFLGLPAGTGRYAAELCRVLDAALPAAEFVVYANRPLTLPVDSVRWRQSSDEGLWRHLPAALWFFLRAGRLARRDGVDLFWGPANFLPLGLDAGMPSIVTVLDLVFHLFPDTLTRSHRLAFGLFFRQSIRHASKVLAISEGTSRRLFALCGRWADAIVRPGVSGRFHPPRPDTIPVVLASLGIRQPYFLSVSTQEPRKNLATLIKAFLELSGEPGWPDVQLVLVGQRGWRNQALNQLLDEARVQGASIVLTGYVDDGCLPALYTGAVAVVMPSLYEGFGMPVLEARCCGARVIASDLPEIREAGGNAPIYVTPTVEGLKDAMRQVLTLPHTIPGSLTPPPQEVPTWETEGCTLAELIRTLTCASV